MRRPSVFLVDGSGQPFSPRIENAVLTWFARLRSGFPTLDDTAVVDVLEEAARRVVRREERAGPIEHVHAYAWTAIRSVAASRLRLGRERVAQMTTARSDKDRVSPATLSGRFGPSVEARVLLGQVLRRLTPLERRVFRLKSEGFSTREIAGRLGRAPATIDSIYSRSMAKLRSLAGERPSIPAPR